MGTFVATDTSPPPPTDDTPSGRSFLSRLALPLRSRARHLADFHIRPDEPHRQYQVGDAVRGAVILTIVKPIRITHLTVALHGYVRVFKGPQVSEPAPAPPASTGVVYHGNGHASLFQDEQVLSGEGKLEPGRYEFNFDLVFPDTSLPSSIEFERGSISYAITATLTRPTPIAPMSTCDRKVSLMEVVDIGPLTAPRPRTIYLEPISKRTRRKKPALTEKVPAAADKAPAVPATPDLAADLDASELARSSEDPTHDIHGIPRSPIQSDIRSEFSGDSAVSTSTGLSVRGTDSSHGTATVTHLSGSRMHRVDEKTITATIELLRGGVLPGDMVPVKVSVHHIKRIKSMHGIIATMYRQGKIDSAPPPSLFANALSKEDARRLQKEDMYPRSRTGLGGLSLSSTSSLSVFRKDLSQAVAPLITDPVTLSTSITLTVKVPDNVFPTIKGVPGDMISFKYQIEVIVDLGGRLKDQLQSSPPARQGQTTIAPNGAGTDGAIISTWGGNLLDTDQLRREKGVISVGFEVIVGTVDSTRQRARGVGIRGPVGVAPGPDDERTEDETKIPYWPGVGNEEVDESGAYYLPPQLDAASNGQPGFAPGPESVAEQVPLYVPPPEHPNVSALSEKERSQRAEAVLLPSQPGEPDATNPAGESSQPGGGPSSSSVPMLRRQSLAGHDGAEDAPSAPTMEDITAGRPPGPAADKLELEHQRLLREASAPAVFLDDHDGLVEAAPAGDARFEPSAPTLAGDEDEFGQYGYRSATGPSSSRDPAGQEPLPRYER